MKLRLLIFFALIGFSASAQQNYDAGLIPKELLPYASSVVRDDETTVEVKDLDNVIYHYKRVITVLNKNGDDDAEIVIDHNKFYTIKYIKGAVYDGFGKQTDKFTEGRFEDVNAQDGFSLYDDTKVKHYKPTAAGYPYTVEYEYELHSKESLNLGSWEPNPGTGIAVEKSSYTITCKPDFNIRYKEINMPGAANIATNEKTGLKTYSWQINNLKAIKYEPYEPNPDKYLSIVKFAPEKFSYGGMTGSYTNWNELGKWIYDHLLVNRGEIPAETIAQVQQMTAAITDPKLKAKKIYEYVQNKTHYVNVTVGIGGWQPILATDVDKLNYGDCKALVNYTQALLRAVNIDSYYCVVMGNHDRKISLLNNFASMDQANHIILCIPFKNDTTWCDCTSQTIPFGYIGDFTDDRNVLACTPQGGKLLHTPKYTAENNSEYRKANFVLTAGGELSGGMTTNFKGINYWDRDEIIEQAPSERLKTLQKIYPITNLDIQKLEYKQDKTLDPVTTESIELKAPEYASSDDGKITFILNTANRDYTRPKQVINRKTDVYINEGYTDEDEITYTLPSGYHAEYTPSEVTLKKPFGSFAVTSTIKDGKLVYKRKLQLIDGTYPKDTYQDLVDFFQSVVDADASTITLIKNN
jgi:hypothetical protein